MQIGEILNNYLMKKTLLRLSGASHEGPNISQCVGRACLSSDNVTTSTEAQLQIMTSDNDI